jgi:hypothetical protein
MTVIDLTNTRAVIESDGTVKCVNCMEGGGYQKGCDSENEILVTQDDLRDPNKLIICDYCETEVNH